MDELVGVPEEKLLELAILEPVVASNALMTDMVFDG